MKSMLYFIALILYLKDLKTIKDTHLKLLTDISSQLSIFPEPDLFIYLLKATDSDLIPIVGKWLFEVNQAYKEHYKKQRNSVSMYI